jgi:hypothetical protein
MKNTVEKFRSPKCEKCRQTTQVLYALDHGTADLVKAVLVRIKLKNDNRVHLRREMMVLEKDFTYNRLLNEGVCTSSMVQNGIRAHKHGLLARVKYEPGVWCLTRKGAAFLRGESVSKYVLQDKATKHIVGYWHPEVTTTVHELQHEDAPYWAGGSFDIVEGRLTGKMADEDITPLF